MGQMDDEHKVESELEPSADGAGALIGGGRSVRNDSAESTFQVELDTGSFMVVTITGDEMYIENVQVPSALWGKGQQQILLEKALAGTGNINVISGHFDFVNELVYRENIDNGYSPIEAAKNTPAGKLTTRAGFTELEFDEDTLLLKGRKPQP